MVVTALNGENAEALALIRALVEVTGETATTAVLVAVRERLARVQEKSDGSTVEERAARILTLGRDISPRLRGELALGDHGDLM